MPNAQFVGNVTNGSVGPPVQSYSRSIRNLDYDAGDVDGIQSSSANHFLSQGVPGVNQSANQAQFRTLEHEHYSTSKNNFM